MNRFISWFYRKIPADQIYYDCYGRGIHCNIDAVWSDRLLYQNFGKISRVETN